MLSLRIGYLMLENLVNFGNRMHALFFLFGWNYVQVVYTAVNILYP
uniref:Uncharacterized protein n=1 Tax=Rhizophora mucronata TaxID=61149 RepID=A0A2P2Q3D8_RHIMU